MSEQPENGSNGKVSFLQPTDRGLDAFKQFVNDVAQALDLPAEDDMTEAEWVQAWQDFWAGEDAEDAAEAE